MQIMIWRKDGQNGHTAYMPRLWYTLYFSFRPVFKDMQKRSTVYYSTTTTAFTQFVLMFIQVRCKRLRAYCNSCLDPMARFKCH